MSDTRRKPKTGAKAVDHRCRNHGTCPSCQRTRRKKKIKREPKEDLNLIRGLFISIPDNFGR